MFVTCFKMKEKTRQTSEACFNVGLFALPSVFPVCSFQTFGVSQASVTGHFIGLRKIKTSHLNACCMSITEGKDVI